MGRADRKPAGRWRDLQIAPRRTTELGISFRPLQAEAMGLEVPATLQTLLQLPFELVRLGAYWNRVEYRPGIFDAADLDWQVDAAERAGKKIVLCLGAVKTFGYPEFFVPSHHLQQPLNEGSLVDVDGHSALLAAATEFVVWIVERYRSHPAIAAWQVEHEAVDPLGMEHSWRLATEFVATEVEAVRKADPTRPIMMNGFLAASWPVHLQQWWRTRDQGDSLALAARLGDIVGVDFYPRHALLKVAGNTIYMTSGLGGRQQRRQARRLRAIGQGGRRVMISEGQAEPWEAEATPPNPLGRQMYSCTPEHVIENYNRCMRWAGDGLVALDAYLFWGAEYWVLRDQTGDPSYLQAVSRILGAARG